jgi:hypothetical protein
VCSVFFGFLFNVMLCKCRVVSTHEDILFQNPLIPSLPTQNKIVNYVLDFWVYRTYQDVLYYFNHVRFHDTCINVILSTPTRRVRPSLPQMLGKSEVPTRVMCKYIIPHFNQIETNVESAGSNSYTPLSKAHGLVLYESHSHWTNSYRYLCRRFSDSNKKCIKW